MHGYGRYVLSDGKRYEGQYADDTKHGYGIFLWPDGRLYKGHWKNGKQHGLAEYQTITPPSDDEGGKGSLRSRYGLWKDGQRLRWFTIDKSLPLAEQFATIEREMIESLAVTQEELSFFTFKSPSHFYEQLAQTYVEANHHKTALKALELGGDTTVKNGLADKNDDDLQL